MSEDTWFIRDKDRIRGPFSHDQIMKLHQRGQLARFHDISTDRKNWVKAATLLDVTAHDPRPVEPTPPWPNPSQDGPASRPTMAHQWPEIPSDQRLVGDRPLPRTSRSRWAIAIAAPCVLIAIGLLFLAFRHDGISAMPTPFADGSTIQSLDDDEKVAGAVGLVVVGIEQKMPDGTHGDKTISTGTCFAISEDGTFVTNRHVVEFHDQMTNAQDIDQRKLVYLKKVAESDRAFREIVEKGMDKVPADKQDETREERMKAYSSALLKQSAFDPKIWIFLMGKNNRPVKHLAQIEYLCDKTEFDIAILKIKRPKGEQERMPIFRMLDNDKIMKKGDSVIALGFPGVTRDAVSVEEGVEERLRKSLASRVDSLFKDRDFLYVRTEGKITQLFADKVSGCRWIQHNADITHGNSGGPLVNPQGLVVGVNTRGDNDGATYRAISAAQLREVIEKYAAGPVFAPR